MCTPSLKLGLVVKIVFLATATYKYMSDLVTDIIIQYSSTVLYM